MKHAVSKINTQTGESQKNELTYTTAKKKRPNQLGYLVGIWL